MLSFVFQGIYLGVPVALVTCVLVCSGTRTSPFQPPLVPQIVEYNSTSSLYEQLLQMRATGVYVSVHTSNLANAPLLQPGSAVVELLHVSGE